MKLNCGFSKEERVADKIRRSQEEDAWRAEWHRFYAIWPRRVGLCDCRCFEWIERRGVYSKPWIGRISGTIHDGNWSYEYRAISNG